MDYIDDSLAFTDDFRDELPELLGDDYYNDPETKLKPTKEFDNIKDLPTLLKKTLNASRKISAHGEELKKSTEGMIKIPGEGATPDEIAAYRKAQGVPDGPEGYDLAIPEDGYKESNTAIANIVKAAAHEAGISPNKLSAVWSKVVASINDQARALEAKGQELLAADVQALKDAKKEKYDAFIADTNRVAAHFDVKGDPDAGIEENLVGSNFMKLMEAAGYKDLPAVREFLGSIAPLVLEGKTAIGAGKAGGGGESWFTDYDEVNGPKQ